MKEEKEIHFIINREEIDNIKQQIENCGFLFSGIKVIKDTYFEDKDYSLAKNKKGYRTRRVNGKKQYSYKEMKDGKVYEDFLTKPKFLKRIKNLNNKIYISKERYIYYRAGCEIVIDDIGKLGCMLEIECEKENPEDIFKELNIKEAKRTKLGCNELPLSPPRDQAERGG